jgi:hypothetical protein
MGLNAANGASAVGYEWLQRALATWIAEPKQQK